MELKKKPENPSASEIRGKRESINGGGGGMGKM